MRHRRASPTTVAGCALSQDATKSLVDGEGQPDRHVRLHQVEEQHLTRGVRVGANDDAKGLKEGEPSSQRCWSNPSASALGRPIDKLRATLQSPDALCAVDHRSCPDESAGARVKGVVPLVLAAGLATLFVWTGTHDLECYENAFYSLNRGTSATVVSSFGQPVYTLSLGLGTRLPLHGNLGASPAAALARVLPDPATHWLLLTLSMAAAALLVVYALQPLGGPLVAWGGILTLFWSQPMVAYTVFNDWPETAVTYCALVGGIFAPHALAMAGARRDATARWTRPSLLAITFCLLATAHPGTGRSWQGRWGFRRCCCSCGRWTAAPTGGRPLRPWLWWVRSHSRSICPTWRVSRRWGRAWHERYKARTGSSCWSRTASRGPRRPA